ncbi:MAG: DUF2971 domain-containing protein [Bacteroidota bacterium]
MKKLFHYTSINNLALILKTKSIRFGRLDNVNDPEEGKANDFHSLSPYIFISSWTENEEENFALWNMYTQNMRGVRIELSLPIFESYSWNNYDNYLFQQKDYLNEKKGYFIVDGLNEPHKIEYSDDINLLKPNIRNDIGLELEILAKCKKSMWTFEQEYRFRLDIFPIDKNVKSDNFPDKYVHLIENKVPPPIDSYFIKIKDDSFKQMIITTGPKNLPGDYEIIEALISKYNKPAQLEISKLNGLIR